VWWNYIGLGIAAIGKLPALFFAVDSELMRSLSQLYERTIRLEIRSRGTEIEDVNAADSVVAAAAAATAVTVAKSSVPMESNRWRLCDKYAEKPKDVNDKNY